MEDAFSLRGQSRASSSLPTHLKPCLGSEDFPPAALIYMDDGIPATKCFSYKPARSCQLSSPMASALALPGRQLVEEAQRKWT